MRTPTAAGLTALLLLVLTSAACAEPLLRAARYVYGSFDASAAVIADLDEDGIPDVASGDTPASQIRLFKGAGDGTLAAVSPQRAGGRTVATRVAIVK